MAHQADDDGSVVIVGGSTEEQLAQLRWQLHDLLLAGSVRILADVSHVHRVSSTALAALLSAHRRCRARGGGVVLRGCNESTLDLLHRNGLHRVFQVEPSGQRARRRPKGDAA